MLELVVVVLREKIFIMLVIEEEEEDSSRRREDILCDCKMATTRIWERVCVRVKRFQIFVLFVLVKRFVNKEEKRSFFGKNNYEQVWLEH